MLLIFSNHHVSDQIWFDMHPSKITLLEQALLIWQCKAKKSLPRKLQGAHKDFNRRLYAKL